jgi:threonyl-tRNA synthetase
MVHRSLAGSMERLFAMLIEIHDGAFPAWYAPVQLAIAPVGEAQHDYAYEFAASARRAGLRVDLLADGSVGSRVREAIQRKIPYAAVIGAREVSSGNVSLRLRDGSELPPQSREEVIGEILRKKPSNE